MFVLIDIKFARNDSVKVSPDGCSMRACVRACVRAYVRAVYIPSSSISLPRTMSLLLATKMAAVVPRRSFLRSS